MKCLLSGQSAWHTSVTSSSTLNQLVSPIHSEKLKLVVQQQQHIFLKVIPSNNIVAKTRCCRWPVQCSLSPFLDSSIPSPHPLNAKETICGTWFSLLKFLVTGMDFICPGKPLQCSTNSFITFSLVGRTTPNWYYSEFWPQLNGGPKNFGDPSNSFLYLLAFRRIDKSNMVVSE